MTCPWTCNESVTEPEPRKEARASFFHADGFSLGPQSDLDLACTTEHLDTVLQRLRWGHTMDTNDSIHLEMPQFSLPGLHLQNITISKSINTTVMR
ncbi:unnamed protein product [Caretta caretta]